MKYISSALFILCLQMFSIAYAADVKVTTPSERLGFYRWIAKEMMEQVYARPATKRVEIENWAGVMAQGGSLEGIYHGIILSTDYDALEKGKSDIRAIRFYATEMAKLEQGEKADPKAEQEAVKRLVKENFQASPFTLKKALGEKILSAFEKKRNDKAKLAKWYAESSARWANLEIPFGMKQRENKDADFHEKWAMENNLGLVQWEMLNKVHRIINFYSGLKVEEASKPVATTPAGK